jgi:RNA polymerase-binding transcription factor DksA
VTPGRRAARIVRYDRLAELSTRDLLETEKLAAIARVEALTAEFDDIIAGTGDGNSDDEHDPEGSTIAFERARVSTLLSQARTYLGELHQAESRIANGTYGACEHCGVAIPRTRLEALPTTRTCIRCRPH